MLNGGFWAAVELVEAAATVIGLGTRVSFLCFLFLFFGLGLSH